MADDSEMREALEFIKANFCTSPLPLRCPICSKGNMGAGFDYCYLRHILTEPEVERKSK